MSENENADREHAISLLARSLQAELEEEMRYGTDMVPRLSLKDAGPAGLTAKNEKNETPKRGSTNVPAMSSVPRTSVSEAARAIAAATEQAPVTDERRSPLVLLKEETVGDCKGCKLHRGRVNLVFGEGAEDAELLFIGEAPGANEDRLGRPFVGKSGDLLTKMIEKGMGIKRSDVYICNVVKCRPPNNRDPEADELAACESFLKEQVRLIKPKAIVTLGKYATHAILKTRAPISKLRGNFALYEGVPVMPTFHPAYLLRDASKKREAWSDLKQVMAKLAE